MFEHYLDDEQMNFQINRVAIYGPDCIDMNEVRPLLPQMRDRKSWTREWLMLAHRAESEKRWGQAVYYYRMAEFYLPDTSSDKALCYRKFRAMFDAAHAGEPIDRIEVPYEGTYLPVLRLKSEHEKAVLVIHGGYDSFMEEFYPQLVPYWKAGYTLILFEGPGQGQARKNGLTFTPEWEKPTSAVLDALHLKNVTLMGISMGGYLAPRAAAHDARIQNVICYDMFYWGMDILLNRLSPLAGQALLFMLHRGMAGTVNFILKKKMAGNVDLAWKLTHGMYITGTKSPYEFLHCLDGFRLADCAGEVTQNVMILAGEKDQYVPFSRLAAVKAAFCHAASLTCCVFTAQTGGEQHCQVGELHLAETAIDNFLQKTAAG
jgi:pimeloyl-ACP methyl ester carboxylesterase